MKFETLAGALTAEVVPFHAEVWELDAGGYFVGDEPAEGAYWLGTAGYLRGSMAEWLSDSPEFQASVLGTGEACASLVVVTILS